MSIAGVSVPGLIGGYLAAPLGIFGSAAGYVAGKSAAEPAPPPAPVQSEVVSGDATATGTATQAAEEDATKKAPRGVAANMLGADTLSSSDTPVSRQILLGS